MMEYAYKTILINGKKIPILKIRDGSVQGSTPFERSTFSFIKSWLSGQKKFTLKTSGSTGAPKKIGATRKQLTHSATLTLQALSIKRGGKILLCITPDYIGGKMMLVRALINNMRIEAVEPSGFNKNSNLSTKYTLAAFVPLQIQNILYSRKTFQHVPNIEHILIGGAPLAPKDSFALSKSKTNVYATYGMTETFSHVALKRISPIPENAFAVLPAVNISMDHRGCLIIKAPFLKKEIITNDIVEITGTGFFRWLGRFDNVINSGGVKVIPEHLEIEIQKIADELAITNRFYITGEPDTKLGEKVVLVLEGKKLDNPTEKKFRDILRDILPRYHAPKKISYVQQFTIVNDKIKRE